MSGASSDKHEKIRLVDENHEIDWKPRRRNRVRNRRAVFVVCLAIVVVGVIAAAVALGTTVGRSSSSSTADDPWLNVRLPSNIQPRTYDLSLTVDLGKFTVQGSVTIAASVQAATPYIIVHALDMDISSATVSSGSVSKLFFYSENQFYVIAMKEALPAGQSITITLNFNYNLTSGLSGFYRSSYNTISGTTAYLATTQFEPTDARRAFPCFDEPAFKANFTIRVTHDCHYTAVSNMPVSSTSGDPTCTAGNTVTTNFQTSVKMSTYLVAFIVSQFQYINGSTGGNNSVKVSVWSNPDVLNKTSLALKVGVEALSFYNSYYGISYPLKKQDFFAIPDFSAGAMENWGLITYRETALLYDNTTGPVSSKQRVAIVIAHELAHQWFGDLVTMEWWDGLWLNEGFATFMEYLGTNNSFPEWNLLEQFFTDVNQVAMLEDGLNETHPIIQAASTPAEINELFDAISYEKGGSVIRMIRDWMGDENFRQGIQSYLKMYAYQNAATDMLWQSLQKYSASNIASIMDTWTKQMGYPVVTVKRTSPTTASVSQKRFFFLTPNGAIAPSPYNYVWMIPFKYTTSPSGNIASTLIDKTATTIALDSSQTWIKANVQQMGFYRVNYDQDNWQNLTAYLKGNNWTLLSALDRAGLIDDAFALSSAGHVDTTVAFNLSTYLLQETEYVPWVSALTWINIFADRLSLTPIYGQYQSYVLSLLANIVKNYTLQINSSDLSDVQNLLRASVLGAAFRFGNTAVTQEAAVLFKNWRNNNTILDPNIKTVVYSAGIALGTEDDWNFMWNKFLTETDPYEKRLYISALAKSTQPWILNRYLAYSLSDNVRSQDTLSVIQAVSSTVNGRYLAWYFVRNNWSVLLSRYGTGSFSLTSLIRVITEAFSTELELNEAQEFFAANPDAGSGTRAVLQAIESIKANIQWVNSNQNGLGTWLNWWITH